MAYNPWLSFDSYSESQAARFKGRDKDIDHVFRLVSSSDISVLYAESGIGKSSLINAGLKPRLRTVRMLPVPVLMKDGPPEDFEQFLKNSLEEAVEEQNSRSGTVRYTIREEDFPAEEKEELDKVKSVFGPSLWWYLKSHFIMVSDADSSYSGPVIPVFILDQFEEYLRLDEKNIRSLFSLLSELSNTRIPDRFLQEIEKQKLEDAVPDLSTCRPFNILLSLREEFMGQLDYWAIQTFFIPSIKENRYCLRPLSAEQARSVISGQRDEKGNEVRTLDGLRETILRQSLDNSTGQLSSLLLSVLCYKYYEKAKVGDDGVKVPLKDADRIERPEVIIGEFYDERMRAAGVSVRHRRKIENALVDNAGQRQRIKIEKAKALGKIKFEKRYKRKLERSHLIKVTPVKEKRREDGQETVAEYFELVHDRVAELIFARRQERSAQVSKVYSRTLVGLALLLSIVALTYFAYNSRRGGAARVRYTGNYGEQLRFHGKLDDNPEIQNVTLDEDDFANEEMRISNCRNLRSVSLQKLSGRKRLYLSGNPNQNALRIGGEADSLMLYIQNCPKLIVSLSDSLSHIEIIDLRSPVQLEPLGPDHPHLYLENGVLWSKDARKPLYVPSDSSDVFHFPDFIQDDVIRYYYNYYYSYNRVDYYHRDLKNAKDSANWISRDGPRLTRVNYWPYNELNFDHPSLQGITRIEARAVEGNATIERVVLSKEVTQIGELAFAACPRLRTFLASDSCEIASNAFNDCPSLDSLALPRFVRVFLSSDQLPILNNSKTLSWLKLPHRFDMYSTVFSRYTEFPNAMLSRDAIRGAVIDTTRLDSTATVSFMDGVIRGPHVIGFQEYFHYTSAKSNLGMLLDDKGLVLDIPPEAEKGLSREKNPEIRHVRNVYNLWGRQAAIARGSHTIRQRDLWVAGVTEGKLIANWNEITRIEVLSPRPWLVSKDGYDSLPFLNDIPKGETGHITLIVPKGSGNAYREWSKGTGFDGIIQEASRFSCFIDLAFVDLQSGLAWFQVNSWGIVMAVLAILLAISLYYNYLKKHRTAWTKTRLWAVSATAVLAALAIWFFVYWPLYHILARHVENKRLSALFANVAAIGIAFLSVRLMISRDFDMAEMWRAAKSAARARWKGRREIPRELLAWLKKHRYRILSVAFAAFVIYLAYPPICALWAARKERPEKIAEAEQLLEKGGQAEQAAALLWEVLPRKRGVHRNDTLEIQAALLLQRAMHAAGMLPAYDIGIVSPNGRWLLGRENGRYYILDSQDFRLRKWLRCDVRENPVWMSDGDRLLIRVKGEVDSLYLMDVSRNDPASVMEFPNYARWIACVGKNMIIASGGGCDATSLRPDSIFVISLSEIGKPLQRLGNNKKRLSNEYCIISEDDSRACICFTDSLLVLDLQKNCVISRIERPKYDVQLREWCASWSENDSLAVLDFATGTKNLFPYRKAILGRTRQGLLAGQTGDDGKINIRRLSDSLFSAPFATFDPQDDRFVVEDQFIAHFGQKEFSLLNIDKQQAFRIPLGWSSRFVFANTPFMKLGYRDDFYVMIPSRRQLEYFRECYNSFSVHGKDIRKLHQLQQQILLHHYLPDSLEMLARSDLPRERTGGIVQDTVYHSVRYDIRIEGDLLQFIDPVSGRIRKTYRARSESSIHRDDYTVSFIDPKGQRNIVYQYDPSHPFFPDSCYGFGGNFSWFSSASGMKMHKYQDRVVCFSSKNKSNPSQFLMQAPFEVDYNFGASAVVYPDGKDSVIVISVPSLKRIAQLPKESHRYVIRTDSLGYQSPYYKITGCNTYLIRLTPGGEDVVLSYNEDKHIFVRSYDGRFQLSAEPGRLYLRDGVSGGLLAVIPWRKDFWFSDDSRILVVDGKPYYLDPDEDRLNWIRNKMEELARSEKYNKPPAP